MVKSNLHKDCLKNLIVKEDGRWETVLFRNSYSKKRVTICISIVMVKLKLILGSTVASSYWSLLDEVGRDVEHS